MNNSAAERVHGPSLSFIPWRIHGRGPGGPAYPLFLDQSEIRTAEKNVFADRLPLLSKGLDDSSPPPALSQGLDSALLFTTQTITIRRLCCHSSQTWQGRGRGAQTGTHFTSQSTLTVMIVFIGKFSMNL